MTLYTCPDLVGLLRRTLKRTHPDVSSMELAALCWLVSQTRRHCPTPSIGEPWIEAPIIELEATSRAAERRSRAIPARSRAEARQALRASERTQSNEAAPGSRCLTKRASSARAASNAPGSGLPLFRAYLKSQSPKSPKSEESEVRRVRSPKSPKSKTPLNAAVERTTSGKSTAEQPANPTTSRKGTFPSGHPSILLRG